MWALVVNDEAKGDIDLVLTPEGPWVDPARLITAGLEHLTGGQRRAFPPDTTMRVSVTSLAPLVTYQLDQDQIRLVISADPSLMAATSLKITHPWPPGWKVQSNSAIFLN